MNKSTVGLRGNCIKLLNGYLDLDNPDPDMITIEEIANALSKICRFGGRGPKFYSVAEHSVLAMLLYLDHEWTGPKPKDENIQAAARAILLHDAHEAFVGDIVTPIKAGCPSIYQLETRIDRVIEAKFGVSFEDYNIVIKTCDRIMLKAEKRALWPDDLEDWGGLDKYRDVKPGFGFLDNDEAYWFFMGAAERVGLR